MTNRLKVHVLNPFIKAENCSICFETLRESVELKCGHEFHLKCIDIWIDNYQKNCPLCRHIFMPTPQSSPISTSPISIIPPPNSELLSIIIPPPPIIIPPIEFPLEASNTQSNSTQSNTLSNTPSGSPNSPIVIVQQQQLTCCIVQ